MAPRCLFSWPWLLPLMLAVAAVEEQAEGCSAKSCGNLTISNPFWLTDMETGRSCGVLDFEVNCSNNNTPVLRGSGAYGFSIVAISYEDSSLHVVDIGTLNYLNYSGSCHVLTWNTSAKLSGPFSIDPSNLNLVLYNSTTAAAARRDAALVEMGCGSKGNTTFARVGGRYDSSENYENYVEGCVPTFLPVLGSSGEANASKGILDGI